MSKFKVGDKVRKVTGYSAPYTMVIDAIDGEGERESLRGSTNNVYKGDYSRHYELVVTPKSEVEDAIAECEANMAKLKAQLADLVIPQVGDKVVKRYFTVPNGGYHVLRAIVTWRGTEGRGNTQYVVQYVAKDQDPNDTSDLDICSIVDAVNWKKLDDQ